jgi:hypothetical protein
MAIELQQALRENPCNPWTFPLSIEPVAKLITVLQQDLSFVRLKASKTLPWYDGS